MRSSSGRLTASSCAAWGRATSGGRKGAPRRVPTLLGARAQAMGIDGGHLLVRHMHAGSSRCVQQAEVSPVEPPLLPCRHVAAVVVPEAEAYAMRRMRGARGSAEEDGRHARFAGAVRLASARPPVAIRSARPVLLDFCQRRFGPRVQFHKSNTPAAVAAQVLLDLMISERDAAAVEEEWGQPEGLAKEGGHRVRCLPHAVLLPPCQQCLAAAALTRKVESSQQRRRSRPGHADHCDLPASVPVWLLT